MIELTLKISVDEVYLKQKGIHLEDVINDLTVVNDDVADGFVITRKGKLGDVTQEFYLDNCDMESRIR